MARGLNFFLLIINKFLQLRQDVTLKDNFLVKTSTPAPYASREGQEVQTQNNPRSPIHHHGQTQT